MPRQCFRVLRLPYLKVDAPLDFIMLFAADPRFALEVVDFFLKHVLILLLRLNRLRGHHRRALRRIRDLRMVMKSATVM